MKNFISLSIAVPQYSKAYGLGEFSKLEKIFDDSIYSMWTRSDEEGAHPFILLLSNNGTASGIYIDSTYPMDITLKRDYNINIVILQTELKIRFFTGPTVADVIRQYWDVIGAPCRPPYWGLGHFYGSEKIASHKELLELIQTNHTTLGKLPVEGILLPSAMNRASLPFSYTQQTRDYIKSVTDNQKLRFIVTVPPGITSLPVS
ncbi:lysosomal alpha-glucosidase-like [Bolinopsis microptera]|uniref:lysosomal alpha-glucosidase-like n=1 Tax=Bolinopsis microptera TaxID=2820187 RepID=UPI00307988C8